MSGDPEIVSFVAPLASGEKSYFIEFPSSFAVPPLVTSSLYNEEPSDIIPYILSNISTNGFYINFASALTNNKYTLNVSAQVIGSHSIGEAADSFVPGGYNGTILGVLATKIYDEEIGFLTSGPERITEIGLIANWLEGHLGELNNLIFTQFKGYDPEQFNIEEQAIIREMYLSEYNRKAHRRVLRGIDGSGGTEDFQMIREGDSMIQKSNKNITAKSYRDAYLDSQERIKVLVHAYNLYGAKPSQVAGADAPVSGQSPSVDSYYN